MPGASARYSCLHAPVETVTPPRRQTKPAPFRFPGFRKSRESSISAVSVFLSNLNPLRWASNWGNDTRTKVMRFGKKPCHSERSEESLRLRTVLGKAPSLALGMTLIQMVAERGRYGITPNSTLQTPHWNYSLTGSGYSTPKVSTVTFFMTWGMRGLSL